MDNFMLDEDAPGSPADIARKQAELTASPSALKRSLGMLRQVSAKLGRSPQLRPVSMMKQLDINSSLEEVETRDVNAALKNVLADRLKRNQLVQALEAIKSPKAADARFISAFKEYMDEKDKATKRSKGLKIVSLYIQNGAAYQLETIPAP